jgi:hypothetical protein
LRGIQSFHGQLDRRVATVVFLSAIWLATKDNKRGFKKKKKKKGAELVKHPGLKAQSKHSNKDI